MKLEREFLYKKVKTGGRPKYEPVREIDVFNTSYPFGTHLVVVDGSHTIYKYHVEKDFASITAAATSMVDDLVDVLVDASEARPDKTPITKEQQEAWENCKKAFNGDFRVYYPSRYDIANKIMEAIENRAKELLTNEAIKDAFEQYQTIAALSKVTKNEHN